MSAPRPRLLTLFALVFLTAGAPSCRSETPPPAPERTPRDPLFEGREAIAQELAGCSLDTQAPTALDGMSLLEIVAFRRERVARHARLHVFPRDYGPLASASARIWRSITPGRRWLGPTPYYVENPYLLIVATCANHVTPLNLACPDLSLRYRSGVFHERHAGDSARCWLRRVHEPPYADHPGSVRLVMVNAYDAGYRFAHLDPARSRNVLPEEGRANVGNGLFSQSSFFHVGRHEVNNISPEDRNGWIRLARPAARTLLVVKLWREAPASPDRKADLEYRIDVDPGGSSTPPVE
jgi:hypothetical protein